MYLNNSLEKLLKLDKNSDEYIELYNNIISVGEYEINIDNFKEDEGIHKREGADLPLLC